MWRLVSQALVASSLVMHNNRLRTPTAERRRGTVVSMSDQLQTLEPSLKRVVVTGMGGGRRRNGRTLPSARAT